MSMTATYSPEDNKLRLYASARLDKETYARVRAAGFIWAPKQELFVAPMWTPSREDLLLELCGEIGDEDTSLVDRAETRAERFEDYSDARATDASRAHDAVKQIADNIPLGQPILVGHHSEKHARKDAEKIENGMRRAVKMWEQSQYWRDRAAGAIHHAKYKELPAVRARRIKTIEADQRKEQKERDYAVRMIGLWETLHDDNATKLKGKDGTPTDFLTRARWLANIDHHLGIVKNDTSTYGYWSAWDVLRPDGERYSSCPSLTPEQVQEKMLAGHRGVIGRCDRWLQHYANRLEYERAMLAESGGTVADRTKPEQGGACRCWASPHAGASYGWSYIQKVNKVSVTVLDNWGNRGDNFTRTIPFDKLHAVMSKADVDAARAAGVLVESSDKTGFFLLEAPPPCEGCADEAQPHAPHCHARREAAADDSAKDFQAMREALKAGVQVVTAPQLFPTPPEIAARMVELAGIEPQHRVLEPSAGTGAIIAALPECAAVVVVERSNALCRRLNTTPKVSRVVEGDFLEVTSNGHEAPPDLFQQLPESNGSIGQFDRILMNPPFENGSDIKHITHALQFLKPGGRLVAICANGPRQKEKLQGIADWWEELPPDTFAGTGVRTVLLTVDKYEE
jgi:protein-L-isoaspartate O-methyltransferase